MNSKNRKIICVYCKKPIKVGYRKSNENNRSFYAHLGHCKVYNTNSHLNTSVVVVPNLCNNNDDAEDDVNNPEDEVIEYGNTFMELNADVNDHNADVNDHNADVNNYEISSLMLLYQATILHSKSELSEDPFRTGWSNSILGKRRKSEWQDYVLINTFVTSCRLSIRIGDSLLQLIQDLCARHQIHIDLPSSFATIKKAIDRASDKNIQLIRLQLNLPDVFFPSQLYRSMEQPTAAVSSCLQVLAEFLIDISAGDLITEPEILFCPDSGERIISHFTTAYYFQDLVAEARKEYGNDVNVVCIDVNYDGMPVDGLGKRELKPMKIRIRNLHKRLKGKQKCILTVGYGPILPYTDAEYYEMFEGKIFTKDSRAKALTFAKRYLLIPY
jgi:hypothetical protein